MRYVKNLSIGISAAVRRPVQIGDPFETINVEILGAQKRIYVISAHNRTTIRIEYNPVNFTRLFRRTFTIYV